MLNSIHETTETTKACKTCHVHKQYDSYHVAPTNIDGYNHSCKACCKVKAQERNVHFNTATWSTKDQIWLLENSRKTTVADAARHLRRTERAVMSRAKRYRLQFRAAQAQPEVVALPLPAVLPPTVVTALQRALNVFEASVVFDTSIGRPTADKVHRDAISGFLKEHGFRNA